MPLDAKSFHAAIVAALSDVGIEAHIDEIPNAEQTECPLKIKRGKNLARQDRVPEIRRMIIDRLDHQIGDGFTVVVP
jgi:hypothetical protein